MLTLAHTQPCLALALSCSFFCLTLQCVVLFAGLDCLVDLFAEVPFTVNCDDSNGCTLDTCDDNAGCEHTGMWDRAHCLSHSHSPTRQLVTLSDSTFTMNTLTTPPTPLPIAPYRCRYFPLPTPTVASTPAHRPQPNCEALCVPDLLTLPD
jgi:hypothetical protein